jgi:hypothetical protein
MSTPSPVVGDSKPLRARYAAERLEPADFENGAAAAFDALVRAIRGEPHEDPDGDEAEDPWGGPAAVDPRDGPPPWHSAPDPWAVADPSSRKTVGGSVVEVEPPF